jgi:hypothetical protein
MLHRVLHRRLRLFAFKVHIFQELKPNCEPHRRNFASDMLHPLGVDLSFILGGVLLSGEATLRLSTQK